VNKHEQYKQIYKYCEDCGVMLKDGHVMTMKPGGVRVFRCPPCANIYIKTKGKK
jgi:uncharacterized Zn finger protein